MRNYRARLNLLKKELLGGVEHESSPRDVQPQQDLQPSS
jgi:hypothetical protein